jgi:hypothetical protein
LTIPGNHSPRNPSTAPSIPAPACRLSHIPQAPAIEFTFSTLAPQFHSAF